MAAKATKRSVRSAASPAANAVELGTTKTTKPRRAKTANVRAAAMPRKPRRAKTANVRTAAMSVKPRRAKTANPHVAARPSDKRAKPKLLAGGNPQIAKADGDPPVQAYIAALPGWKRDVARRIDALVVRTVPDVSKAVKWNSPFYGIEGEGWFLSIHAFSRYLKLTFFRGTSLRPIPPGESKVKDTRYFDVHEDAPLDEAQLAGWVKQASRLPGERL